MSLPAKSTVRRSSHWGAHTSSSFTYPFFKFSMPRPKIALPGMDGFETHDTRPLHPALDHNAPRVPAHTVPDTNNAPAVSFRASIPDGMCSPVRQRQSASYKFVCDRRPHRSLKVASILHST